jgi:hypothetical protein
MLKRCLILFLLLFSAEVLAYIGPGAGVSVLASLLGVLMTIVVAIGAILFWPIRKILSRKKRSNLAEAGKNTSDDY